MGKALAKLALFVLAVYAFYAWNIWRVQRAQLFPGTVLRAEPVPAGAARVALRASFGRVDIVWMPAPGTEPAGAVLYLHGNYETAGGAARDIAPLQALGLNVVAVEFPGYAGAPGAPTLETLREASTLAFDWLVQQPRVRADAIAVIGRSIGGGPASLLAVERPARALVLLSTFADLEQFAHARLLPAMLIRDRYDNSARLREFTGPVLIMHGRRDPLIPFANAVRLSAAARNSPIVVLDCGHDDCPYFEGPTLRRMMRALADAHVATP